MNRRDFIGRMIGTIGFGVFSSKSCVDYLQAREQEQPWRKEYVDVRCRYYKEGSILKVPHKGYTSNEDGTVTIQISASLMNDYWNNVIVPFDEAGLAVDSVSAIYVTYQ